MNPWPVARAALCQGWRSALAMALLVALGTAIGTGIAALERGARQAAAHAADAFDLIVGAPGGATQLVLAAVYLQPDTVPLLDGVILSRITAEREAVWASPIGFGDQWHGNPVIGVAPAFVTQGGLRALAAGRVFNAEEEAVIGAAVPLQLGDKISPQHGLIEVPGSSHTHEEIAYAVIGRLPPTGTAWDRAILVPIESVWELHGLGNGHTPGDERIGPPWEAASAVPAVVIKPRSIAGAYQLRARYRGVGSTAVFPGEVLAGLFRTIGDVRALLSAMSLATTILVLAAVFLAFSAIVNSRAREHALLRAIGAPSHFILIALWLELAVILGGAVLAGLGLGWAMATGAAIALSQAAGVLVTIAPGWPEAVIAAMVLACGLAAALLPAMLGGRAALGASLKG